MSYLVWGRHNTCMVSGTNFSFKIDCDNFNFHFKRCRNTFCNAVLGGTWPSPVSSNVICSQHELQVLCFIEWRKNFCRVLHHIQVTVFHHWLERLFSSKRSLRSIHWPIPNPIKHLRSAKSQKASGKAANRLMTDKMRPDKYMVIFLPNLSLKGPTTIPPKKNPTKIMDDPMVPYKPRSHTRSNYRQISQAVIRSKDGSNINYNSNKKTFYFKK